MEGILITTKAKRNVQIGAIVFALILLGLQRTGYAIWYYFDVTPDLIAENGPGLYASSHFKIWQDWLLGSDSGTMIMFIIPILVMWGTLEQFFHTSKNAVMIEDMDKSSYRSWVLRQWRRSFLFMALLMTVFSIVLFFIPLLNQNNLLSTAFDSWATLFPFIWQYLTILFYAAIVTTWMVALSKRYGMFFLWLIGIVLGLFLLNSTLVTSNVSVFRYVNIMLQEQLHNGTFDSLFRYQLESYLVYPVSLFMNIIILLGSVAFFRLSFTNPKDHIAYLKASRK